MTVSWEYFSDFKPKFMERTNPEGKGDCALWLENMSEENWEIFKSDTGIAEEHIDFIMMVPQPPISEAKRKIVKFDKYNEFKEARKLVERVLQYDSLESAITIHCGGIDVGIVVEVNSATRESIREIQRESKKPENFTGRDLMQSDFQ